MSKKLGERAKQKMVKPAGPGVVKTKTQQKAKTLDQIMRQAPEYLVMAYTGNGDVISVTPAHSYEGSCVRAARDAKNPNVASVKIVPLTKILLPGGSVPEHVPDFTNEVIFYRA